MAEITVSRPLVTGTTLPAEHNSRGGVGGPGVQSAVTPKATGVDPAAVREAAESLKRRMSAFDRRLDFTVDQELNKIVVKVVDAESGEVIRQIPPEEVLHVAKMMDKVVGLLFDERY